MSSCSCGYKGEEGWDLWIVGPKGIQDGVFCPYCGKNQIEEEDTLMPPKKTKKMEFNVNQVIAALERYFDVDIISLKGVFMGGLLNPVYTEVGLGGILTVVCEVK